MSELGEEITKLIKQWIISNYPIGSQTFSDLSSQIQEFLKSQMEQMENPYPKKPTAEHYGQRWQQMGEYKGYEQFRKDALGKLSEES